MVNWIVILHYPSEVLLQTYTNSSSLNTAVTDSRQTDRLAITTVNRCGALHSAKKHCNDSLINHQAYSQQQVSCCTAHAQ